MSSIYRQMKYAALFDGGAVIAAGLRELIFEPNEFFRVILVS